MPGFLQTLQSRSRAEAARAGARVQEQELRQWGLTGQWPRANFRPPDCSPGPASPRSGPRAADGAGRREGTVLWAVFLRTQHLPSLPFPHLQRRWADRSPSGARWPFPPAQGAGLADAAGEGFRAPGAAQGRGRLVGPRPNGKTFLCRGGGCPDAPGRGFAVSVPVGLQACSWGFRR